MRRLVITMPRIPFLMLALIGLTGIAMALFTDPAFVGSGDFSELSLGRWGALTVALLITLWGGKGVVLPSILFACDRNGVEVPFYARVIQWQYVQDIGVSNMTVGLSGDNRRGPIKSDSIVIRFAESIDLKSGLRPNSHGRITAKHEYTFSTEVQTKGASDLLKTIDEFRTQ